MTTVRRELLIDYLEGTAKSTVAHEAMVILEAVFEAAESGTVPKARLKLYNDIAEANAERARRAELDRLHAFEAIQDASDLRVRGVIMADSDMIRCCPDFLKGNPYEGTIIEMAPENDSGDPALRAVIRGSLGDALFGAVMNSRRDLGESMTIFRNIHAAIHAYLIFAIQGQAEKMIRMARLLHIMPKVVPFAKTETDEVVMHSGDAIYCDAAPQKDLDLDIAVVTGTPIDTADTDTIGALLAESILKLQDDVGTAQRPLAPPEVD